MTKITNTNSQLSRGLYDQVLKQINSRLSKNIPRIKSTISAHVSTYIWSHPTTQEMLSGGTSRLVSVLGLDNAYSRIQDVINSVTSDIVVSFAPYRMVSSSTVKGSFVIKLLNVENVISNTESATIISKNGAYNWLEMLLTAGDTIFGLESDLGHLFRPEQHLKGSRTGHGLLVPNAKTAIRVPPQFSGTINKNWLTRALSESKLQQDIHTLILSIIQ